jgi:hypothetical protein
MSKRQQIGKKLRFEVFKRDQFTCQYCGAHPPEAILHCDHILAVANGGTNDIDNLTTACESCNNGKGARELSSIPEPLAAKASRIAESEEQLLGYQEILRARAKRIEDEQWEVAEALWPGSSEKGANRQDLISIKQFIGKLGVCPVLEAAEIAKAFAPYGGNKMWRYFCGVCWKKIRGPSQP